MYAIEIIGLSLEAVLVDFEFLAEVADLTCSLIAKN
jgi:hypothetical protein